MNWENKIEKAVRKFIKEFQRTPFVYIYEADIQARLYYLISSGINDKNWLYTAKNIDSEFGIKDVKTSPLHTQMAISANISDTLPHRKWTKRHLDIGVWDYEQFRHDNSNYKTKPVLIGIEIKYNWEKKLKAVRTAYFNDIKKLLQLSNKNSEFVGYALWFIPKATEKECMEIENKLRCLLKECRKIHYIMCTEKKVFDNT